MDTQEEVSKISKLIFKYEWEYVLRLKCRVKESQCP
jgi:hypothetical protein